MVVIVVISVANVVVVPHYILPQISLPGSDLHYSFFTVVYLNLDIMYWVIYLNLGIMYCMGYIPKFRYHILGYIPKFRYHVLGYIPKLGIVDTL